MYVSVCALLTCCVTYRKVYIYVCVYIYTCICMYTYVSKYVCMYVCMYTFINMEYIFEVWNYCSENEPS